MTELSTNYFVEEVLSLDFCQTDTFSRSCWVACVAAAGSIPGCFSRCCCQRGFSSTCAPSAPASGSGSFLRSTSISSEAGPCDSFAFYLWRLWILRFTHFPLTSFSFLDRAQFQSLPVFFQSPCQAPLSSVAWLFHFPRKSRVPRTS